MSENEAPRDDAAWRERLSDEQYRVMRAKGTERAFTGRYWDCKLPGIYHCAACDEPLFSSQAKFDSGTGWPSFWAPVDGSRVTEVRDESHGMIRVEVVCSRCRAHLGHVFEDGPAPSGLRYCLNSIALDLRDEDGPDAPDRDDRATE